MTSRAVCFIVGDNSGFLPRLARLVTLFTPPGTGYLFPALSTGYIYVFPRLAPVTCFPALGTGYMFSRAWQRLHVFPRLAPVTCFSALGKKVLPCLPRVACFPALMAPVTCFSALSMAVNCFQHLPPASCFCFYSSST